MDISHLKLAEEYYAQGNYSGALAEIGLAVRDLASESRDFILSVAPTEVEKILLSMIHRVAKSVGAIPDLIEFVKKFLPDLIDFLPSSLGSLPLDDLKYVLVSLFQKAEEEVKESSDEYTNEEFCEDKTDAEKLSSLINKMSEEIQLREKIFSDGGVYQSLSMAASPYVAGALLYLKDEDANSAEYQAEELLQGPGRNLAILCYSFLTSEFLAGLILLFIKRRIHLPFMGKSKISGASQMVRYIVPNIPLIIAGLKIVAEELTSIKGIIKSTSTEITIPVED